jgi:hypothetical protein
MAKSNQKTEKRKNEKKIKKSDSFEKQMNDV